MSSKGYLSQLFSAYVKGELCPVMLPIGQNILWRSFIEGELDFSVCKSCQVDPQHRVSTETKPKWIKSYYRSQLKFTSYN